MVSLGTQPANRKSGFGHSSPTGARAQDLSRQPARPDLWGARVSNDPGLPDLPTMRTFVGTLRAHIVHIMAFIDRPLTNAVGEGLNRLIKIVKNRASGYRHLDYFTDMIYLTVGDLDIPAQIPSQLRTL